MNNISAIIYDLEIIKAIPTRGNIPLEGIKYCAGWQDHANMGVSTLCAYDYIEDRYRVFCGDNLDEFAALLNNRTYRVGFNNINFDDRVLVCNGFHFPSTNQPYDILREIWRAAGVNPDTFNPRTHGGFGLDACAEVNFGMGKTGNGALAPVDWQRGRIGSVIDYCLQDVRLTKMLLDRIINYWGIRDPKKPADPGAYLNIRKPWEVIEYQFS